MGKLITYIKLEEFNRLLKAEKEKEYKLSYLLAFGSGLRLSEIFGYKRKSPALALPNSSAIRPSNKEESELLRDGGQIKEIKPLMPENIDLQAKHIRVIGGKGMKDRVVPLFPGFKEEYLKLLPLTIPRSTVQHHFTSLTKRVLGKPYHFHQLRHGFAVNSINQGVKLPYLQAALGHSRLDTTGIYTQANPQDMLKDYAKAWGIE